ncbi:hypothetical protein [Pseudonocardia spinosispora]|uniref:hypothetical protein n=1 Tax=Pseudonocardia spinosispora TaxID=103441 RepID=UPI0004284142|nr:hypothetical protein [Pseudonocardia spinosispora]
MFTPNERYAALVAIAGYLPLTLTGTDYLELLPVRWRAINDYGIRIDYRTYDCRALGDLLRQHSGLTGKRGLCSPTVTVTVHGADRRSVSAVRVPPSGRGMRLLLFGLLTRGIGLVAGLTRRSPVDSGWQRWLSGAAAGSTQVLAGSMPTGPAWYFHSPAPMWRRYPDTMCPGERLLNAPTKESSFRRVFGIWYATFDRMLVPDTAHS